MLTITLPLPHKVLSPNSKPNRFVLARYRKSYRRTAWLMAMDTINRAGFREPPRMAAVFVELRFFFKVERRHDADNLIGSMKSAMDGFTDAGVWTDDSVAKPLPPVVAIDKGNPRVEVVITERKL
jgi:Holliday junction resolvase RusA-like endonuclease